MEKVSKMASKSSKPCLLYVDDDHSNIVVMEMRLENHYEVLSASTDKEACSILRTAGDRITLVLMDIQLIGSQLDGIAMARLIRGILDEKRAPVYAHDIPARPDLPILFVTAYGESHDLGTLFAAGGSAVVAKPVDFVKLSRAMTRHHLKTVLGTGAP